MVMSNICILHKHYQHHFQFYIQHFFSKHVLTKAIAQLSFKNVFETPTFGVDIGVHICQKATNSRLKVL